MRIARALYDELFEHARADAPIECCGLIAGRDGEATRLVRVRNAEQRERHYQMDPNDQHRALTSIEDAGEDLLAIYHSHPPVGAYFSETDLEHAYMGDGQTIAWPGVIYVVVGLQPEEVKAFSIADHRADEIALDVV